MKKESRRAAEAAATVLAIALFAFLALQYVFKVNIVGYVAQWIGGKGVVRPELNETAGYGLLFVYGLITSLHCVGMCGGMVFTVACRETNRARILENIKYQGARLFAYSAVGLALGGIGGAVSLSARLRAYVPIVSGILMLVIGLSLLFGGGAFPIPRFYAEKLLKFRSANSIAMGLLTGLFPCASMQSVQLYALAAGSALRGMAAMAAFALGTVPLLFLFGALQTVLKNKNWKWLAPCSSILILILAGNMIVRGLYAL
jgi:sulfite exporter TauE/SafE